MINKSEFTDIAKRVLRFNKGLKSPQIMHPQREWLTGLLVAIIFFGSSVAWSAHMYIKYKNLAINGSDVSIDTEVIVYRESLVTAALEEFSSRQELHNELLGVGVLNKAIPDIVDENSSSTDSFLEEQEEGTSTSTTSTLNKSSSSTITTDETIKAEAPRPEEEISTDITPALN